jgi:tetratricopeptide (TPR) repeat protein
MAPLWRVGDRIQDRWEVHRLQRGGRWIVYFVYDHETHLPYSVKTLTEDSLASHPALAERVVQIAQAWMALGEHYNITQVHSIEMVHGHPLVFLEYVSGGSLRDWLGLPRLTQDLPQLLRLAMQCCDGLLHASANGLTVHGHLTPQNCLMTRDGVLKVTDFGLALLTLGSADPGAVPVTHMAPELFDEPTRMDVRTDVYAFGVMLFQMAMGTVPFTGHTWQELAHLQRTQPPPPLSPQSAVLSPLIEACLAQDPAQRCADFHAVRARLAELYHNLTHASAPQPLVGPELEIMQWNDTGASLESLGRYQDALVCYDRALALNSRDDLTWVHRGTVLETLGRTDDALACCDHALQLNPRSEPALVARGMMLGALGQIEEARTYCDRALKINPRNEQAWVNMGVALDALGRGMEALGCYNNALTLNPRNAEAWFNAGVVLGELGRHEEALGCCERSLALNARNEPAWVNRGLTLAELQRPEEALACFEQALALNPNQEQAWFNKGVTLVHAFQRYAEALACFEAAERLGYAPAAEGVALCQQELGQQRDTSD